GLVTADPHGDRVAEGQAVPGQRAPAHQDALVGAAQSGRDEGAAGPEEPVEAVPVQQVDEALWKLRREPVDQPRSEPHPRQDIGGRGAAPWAARVTPSPTARSPYRTVRTTAAASSSYL